MISLKNNAKNIIIGFVIVSIVVIVDQITKYYINKNFNFSRKVEVIPDFFNIVHVRNTGAAWSLFQDQRIFLIILVSILLIIATIVMLLSTEKFLTISLALIIGGGLGNLIDRVFRGSVIDFFEFFIFDYNFPVFNVADICVVIGTFMLSIYILFIYKEGNEIFLSIRKKGE